LTVSEEAGSGAHRLQVDSEVDRGAAELPGRPFGATAGSLAWDTAMNSTCVTVDGAMAYFEASHRSV
jgi:hypothetical protein